MSYKLRGELIGHEGDVRCVAPAIYPVGGILTASRDLTCRVWAPDEEAPNKFVENKIFHGHSGYVAAVCAMAPSDQHPQGLVITGGNDKLILIYDFNSLDPVQRLEGHTATVCTLDAGKFGTILSGSWDKTARVWINGKTVITLSGHEAAVWAVKMIPDQGLMLTASADKTIKLWKAGKCERTYTGHKDCVRGLAILSHCEFLSCSNDCTIRRWTLNGDCLAIYEGHTNFVYSVAVIPGTDGWFVSSGEDRSVKVWKDGTCAQTITLPCVSVWSVDALENGDIIVGSSDDIGRVFTCNENRQASAEKIKEFEEMVGNQAIPAASNLDLGEIKVDQLPGPEALLRPGTKKDHTKLIKRNGIVEAHQWDDANGQWQKVGEVTGAAGEEGTKRTSGKEMYEGKEYDYVFNVDIEEGKPPLKLPFNITDDPWMAAQKFLDRNDISQTFLDQVANFIIDNTKAVTLGATSSNISDPFTGTGRYVPQSHGSASNNSVASSDPFTGAGRYIPNNNGASNATKSDLFPEKNYLTFTNGKCDQIKTKVKEFNQQVPQDVQINDNEIEVTFGKQLAMIERDAVASTILQNAASRVEQSSCTIISTTLKKLVQWPADKFVPVFDLLRIFVLNGNLSDEYIYLTDHAKTFIERLVEVARSVQPLPHSLLAYRILTNSFSHEKAAVKVYVSRKKLLDCCINLYTCKNKNLSIAVSSFVVNCCVLCRLRSMPFEDGVQLCTYIQQFLSVNDESESIFRLLVALGTLLTDNPDLIAFAQSLDVVRNLKSILDQDVADKVKTCTNKLVELLMV